MITLVRNTVASIVMDTVWFIGNILAHFLVPRSVFTTLMETKEITVLLIYNLLRVGIIHLFTPVAEL